MSKKARSIEALKSFLASRKEGDVFTRGDIYNHAKESNPDLLASTFNFAIQAFLTAMTNKNGRTSKGANIYSVKKDK